MKTVAIVPARMDSTRLPGKPLLPLNGRPIVLHVLERARRIPGVEEVVLATTKRSLDDPLAHFAAAHGFQCYRGSVNDVARRFLDCAQLYEADYFVRANGDSPFLDSELVGRGMTVCDGQPFDLVTNLMGRTFPHGIAVEIVKTSVYGDVYRQLNSDEEREHVTTHFYRHPGQFKIHVLTSPRPELSTARLTVDTATDAVLLQRVFFRLGDEALDAGYEKVAGLYLNERRNNS